MAILNGHPYATAAAVLITLYLARFFLRVAKVRRQFAKLPGPPHSPIFGHLISIGKCVSKLPNRVHPHVFPHYLTKDYDLPPVFFMDAYPIRDPMMVIIDPDVAEEVAAKSGLLKAPNIKYFLKPLAGPENLVTMDGHLWKKWRTVFNPGFAIGHLMNQVPIIVDCTVEFARILDMHATENKVFRLEEEATKITIDVIGKVVCDHDFNALTTNNEFVELMRKTLTWMPDSQSLDPFHHYHPLRPFFWWYYKKQMDSYLGKVLDEKFSTRNEHQARKSRKKSGIDLAIEEYFKESGKDVDSRAATMDAEFRRYAIDNLEVLLFAGHDTTASTICYCYHILSKHPDKLATLRQELDEVFGTGQNAAEKLRQDPYIINKCEYTLAIIKEILRMWTPASTVRIGRKDYFVKDPVTGNMLPTEGMLVWLSAISIHRDERNWGKDVQEFRPERFLPENADKIKPNAYRPFEKGPRNCIGQELALLEMKIILALTAREFDVRTAYNELESLSKDGTLWAAEKSQKQGVQECFGDEAYQILLAAAKPREGMPARVTRR
ncbi:cytochrome P450 [Lindgomyces ingoldianus]|uniref:Cytochrome P450 n=1 Tax=Lindgomyces ingoldianus TaxID=673940 RepID=A0ACB6QJW2_9PLEO|nr:cytochrome P450 [Lindgomyces ingoldianus]KAF2467190.1 cytochrome P450 [Lindgomyces ingoldianus]